MFVFGLDYLFTLTYFALKDLYRLGGTEKLLWNGAMNTGINGPSGALPLWARNLAFGRVEGPFLHKPGTDLNFMICLLKEKQTSLTHLLLTSRGLSLMCMCVAAFLHEEDVHRDAYFNKVCFHWFWHTSNRLPLWMGSLKLQGSAYPYRNCNVVCFWFWFQKQERNLNTPRMKNAGSVNCGLFTLRYSNSFRLEQHVPVRCIHKTSAISLESQSERLQSIVQISSVYYSCGISIDTPFCHA